MRPSFFGQRLKQERERIGLSQSALSERLGVSKQTVQNWEGTGGKVTAIPADKLELCARLGIDVQFVLTGVRSGNLDQVAEESGTYVAGEKPQGVGALSRDEEVLIEKYRHLKPGDRTRAQALVATLATVLKKKETG